MAIRRFNDLVAPIKADPIRAARIARERLAALAELTDPPKPVDNDDH
jgi:hypothetical protein